MNRLFDIMDLNHDGMLDVRTMIVPDVNLKFDTCAFTLIVRQAMCIQTARINEDRDGNMTCGTLNT